MNDFSKHIYEYSYKIVDPNKMPIVIPSYNRPEFILLNELRNNLNDEFVYPVFIVVRNSQINDYINSTKDCNNISIVDVDDDLIRNIGLTRRYIIEEFKRRGYHNIFLLDDDVINISCLHNVVNSKGNINSKLDLSLNFYKTMSVFQLSHESLCYKFKNKYILTGISPSMWAYKPEYSNSDNSVRVLNKSLVNIVAINLDNMMSNNLQYNSNDTHGHEDSELMLQIIESGCLMSEITGISYMSSPMNSTMGFESSDERFKEFWDRCIKSHPGVEENKLVTFKKSDIDRIHATIHWRTGRKLYNEEFYKDNKFDILDIIEEYKKILKEV